MITVKDSHDYLKEINVRREGQLITLSEESDPKLLFSVLKELSLYVIRQRKVK